MRKLISALFCCTMFSAQADFYTAEVAFKAGQYDKAIPELTKLAQNGLVNAQFMLAQAYEQGLGVEADINSAYAWYLIAKDLEHPAANDKYLELRRTVPSRREAKERWQELDGLYGKEAFAQNLLPVDKAFKYYPERATLVSKVEPDYPNIVTRGSFNASTIVRFDVNESGNVDDIEIISSIPKGQIDEYVVEALKQWKYKSPLNDRGEPTRILDMVAVFNLTGADRKSQRQFQSEVEQYTGKLRELALEGNHVAQYRLALMLEHEIVKNQPTDTALNWYVRAAQNGNTNAQTRLAHCLSNGEGCETNQVKALNWLKLAAKEDNTRAQFMLAKALLRPDFEYHDQKQAAEWLNKAALAKYMPAVVEYARLLAFSDDNKVRNMAEAVKFAELARSIDANNPTLLSVIGAGYAEFGKVAEAQQMIEQAVAEARKRSWPVKSYLELLEDNKASMLAVGG